MYKKYEKYCVIAGGREVPAETFAGAQPSGWRRHIVVGTGLRQDRPTASEKTHGENVFCKFDGRRRRGGKLMFWVIIGK